MSATVVQPTAKQQPAPAAAAPTQVQEFSIRCPKNGRKKHNVMRFNAVLKVDFKEWKQVKLERENNLKDFRGPDEEIPKFGAGSEFGREAREEARRKKFGITSRKYKSEDQPWLLKVNGKTGKKFKGIREGGVSANAAYYVFTHAPDGAIEAFPLHEWYNFQPIQRYKTLSSEEAEQEFSRRNKTLNYFNLMLRNRLKNDEEGGEDGEGADGEKKSTKKKKKEKDLKISEMDEWMDSDDDSSSEDDTKEDKKKSDDDEEDDKKNKKKVADKKKKKKKKKNASDDEAFEESDDGDEEGRECDYISDSSASDSEPEENKGSKSVAEEDALRKLLASDEEDEDEDEEKKDKEENEDEENKDEKEAESKDKKKDNKGKSKSKKGEGSDSSSDIEAEINKNVNKKPTSNQSSRSATPVLSNVAGPSESVKRALNNSSPDISQQAKKMKMESSYIPGASESGITEDAVRRYLMRKPMTTTELLQKFKSKKTGLTSDQIVNVMTRILKNIQPINQKIKGKIYLSLRRTH